MKKIIIILLAIIGWSSSVKALVCVEGNCNTMGYTTPATEDIADCKAYIYCPYDISFKTCARYNAYPLTETERLEGGIYEQSSKYRFEGCQDGYTLSADGKSCVANAIEKTCDDAIAEAGVLLTSSGEVEDGVTYYIKEDTNIDYFDVSNGSTVIKPAYELSECKNDDSVTENPTLHIEEVQATDDAGDWQVYVPITIEKVYIGGAFPDFSFYRDVTINLIELDNCQITDESQTDATELNFEDDADFNATTYNRTINVACHKNCTDENSIGICLINVSDMSTNSNLQIYDITSDEYTEEEEQGELRIKYL